MRSKIINRLNALEDIVLVSMFAAMVGIIFFQVIMRYVLIIPCPGRKNWGSSYLYGFRGWE